MNLETMGELELIKKLAKSLPVSDTKIVVGIGDDAAVMKTGNPAEFLLWTIDTLVEKVHFTLDTVTPYQLGRKALAVNLSDIAAMGGIPKYALVSLGLRAKTPVRFVNNFYRGLKSLADKYGISLIGGDTVSSPGQLTVTITLLGEVERKYLTLRSGARAGDRILVTGNLGVSTAFRLQGRYLPVHPRVKESRDIVKKFKPSAMIDLSDGLASDLRHICASSRVGAEIWVDKLPISRRTRQIARELEEDEVSLALEGGEDYELLFTLPRRKADKLVSETKFPVSIIGKVTGKRGKIFLVGEDSQRSLLKTRGYEHFVTG